MEARQEYWLRVTLSDKLQPHGATCLPHLLIPEGLWIPLRKVFAHFWNFACLHLLFSSLVLSVNKWNEQIRKEIYHQGPLLCLKQISIFLEASHLPLLPLAVLHLSKRAGSTSSVHQKVSSFTGLSVVSSQLREGNHCKQAYSHYHIHLCAYSG